MTVFHFAYQSQQEIFLFFCIFEKLLSESFLDAVDKCVFKTPSKVSFEKCNRR